MDNTLVILSADLILTTLKSVRVLLLTFFLFFGCPYILDPIWSLLMLVGVFSHLSRCKERSTSSALQYLILPTCYLYCFWYVIMLYISKMLVHKEGRSNSGGNQEGIWSFEDSFIPSLALLTAVFPPGKEGWLQFLWDAAFKWICGVVQNDAYYSFSLSLSMLLLWHS